jgi:hypothetical protein
MHSLSLEKAAVVLLLKNAGFFLGDALARASESHAA